MRCILTGAILLAAMAHGQARMDPARYSGRLRNLIEQGEGARPLQCEIQPLRPGLSYGFRFQAGYYVRVPLRQYEGPGHFWIILSRITPEGGTPTPFIQLTRLPNIQATSQFGEVGGGYMLGAGRYHAELTLIDDSKRICRKEWTIEPKLTRAERKVRLGMAPNTVAELSLRGAGSVPADKDDVRPLRITVMLHAAPLNLRRLKLRPVDSLTLLSSLAALLDRVPASSVRLVAFNLEQQKEIFRQDDFHLDALDQLGDAMNGQQLGLVDYKVLRNPAGHLDLLADLLNQEISAKETPDVVLFLGPLSLVSGKVPQDALEKTRTGAPRFFYFQFQPIFRRAQSVLPDSIHLSISRLKGRTIVIHTPGEFAKAIALMESQVAGGK